MAAPGVSSTGLGASLGVRGPTGASVRHRPWPAGIDMRCLYGDQGDWHNRTVVVPAVFREWYSAAAQGPQPPDWLKRQYPIFLYQRRNASASCYCANHGYESAVYFRFIAQHYSRLPAFVAFIQADWIFATKQSMGGPFQFWQPRCMVSGAAARLPWRDYMPLGGRRTVWPPRCVARQLTWYSRMLGRRNAVVVEACAREVLRLLDWPGTVRPYDRARPLNITFYTNMNFLASRTRLRRYPHRVYRSLSSRFIDEGVCIPPVDAGIAKGGVGGSGGGGGSGSGGSTSGSAGGRAVLIGGRGSGAVATAAPNSSHASSHASSYASSHASSHASSLPSAALLANGVTDSATYAKFTLGMATELLQQAIFGDPPHLLEHGPAPVVPHDGDHCERPHPNSYCTISS